MVERGEKMETCLYCRRMTCERNLCSVCLTLVDTCILCGDFIPIGWTECDECELCIEDASRWIAKDVGDEKRVSGGEALEVIVKQLQRLWI